MKKLIFFILSTVFVLMIPNVVNAKTITSVRENWAQVNKSGDFAIELGNYFTNTGKGNVITNISFLFSIGGTYSSNYLEKVPSIRQVVVLTGNDNFNVCDISNAVVSNTVPNNTSPSYNLQGFWALNYTVSCPVDLSNTYFRGFVVYTNYATASEPIDYVLAGPFYTFVGDDDLSSSIQNNTNAINNVNDSINNDSVSSNAEHSDTASGWASNNASDSVVSDMVLMPITLLNAFSNGFNGSCQSYNLGSLYGTDLTLPCINIQNYLGATLWGIIDVLMSGFLIYGIGKKFVRVFNDFTNLKDSQVDELYGGGNE